MSDVGFGWPGSNPDWRLATRMSAALRSDRLTSTNTRARGDSAARCGMSRPPSGGAKERNARDRQPPQRETRHGKQQVDHHVKKAAIPGMAASARDAAFDQGVHCQSLRRIRQSAATSAASSGPGEQIAHARQLHAGYQQQHG